MSQHPKRITKTAQ